MKIKLPSAFSLQPLAFAALAAFALLTTAPRAPAQSVWGDALVFNGVSSYVQAGAVPLANSSFTLEAWSRRHSVTNLNFIIGQGGGGTDRSLYFGYFDSQFVFGFYNDDLWTTTTYTNTDWHHWAGTYNATNRLRCLYRDGVLIATNTASANYLGSGPLIIGSVPWAPGCQFDGEIDDVRVWSVARSQADIQANMLHPLTGAEPNLMAYWRFDEGTGTNTLDATGNGFNGVLVNSPSWVISTVPQAPAGWGMALSFDGVDDNVSLSRPVSDDFTLECWFQSTNTALTAAQWWGGAGMIDGEVAGVVNDFGLAFGAGEVLFGTGGSTDLTINSGFVADGQWHHAAATRQKSTGTLLLYVDGVQVASATHSAGVSLTSPGQLHIGCTATLAHFFQGKIDEVRIWNVVLTASQIQQTMGQPLTGYEPGLVTYYRFDEGGGIMAYDATPNRNNGTLNNRPVRVPSTVPPPPIITLYGANPLTNQFNVPFVDPGATAGAGFVSIAVGDSALALKADGSLLGWENGYGIPYVATNVVAMAQSWSYDLALRADGSVIGWGFYPLLPASAASGNVAISATPDFSLALEANGTVSGGGDNSNGETTIPNSASNVVAIAAGYDHSLALRADGSVVGWGFDGGTGVTNTPSSATNGVVAIAAGDFYSLALRADGSVVAWGNDLYGVTNIPAGGSNGVVAIAAGQDHALALKADGSVIAWGYNAYGQTSVPSGAASGVVAIAGGQYESLALKADGSIIAWGNGDSQMRVPAIQRTLCPGLTVTGTVNVDVPGTYTLTYTVTNALGIVGTATRTVVVVPDTTPPVLPAQVVLTAPPNNCQAALTAITATDISDPAPVVTCVPPVGTLLPLGLTNVVCVATDASGNSRTGVVQVLVMGSWQSVAPAGEIWTPSLTVTQGAGFTAIASSADGTRLVAVQTGGQIYNSTDGGLTWTPRDSIRNWYSVASSADGTRMVAVDYGSPPTNGMSPNGLIYTSTDSGATWTPRPFNSDFTGGSNLWTCVASSADGTKLAAVGGNGWLLLGAHLYVSTDSGTNWTPEWGLNTQLYCVASSADGTRLAGCSDLFADDTLCTSADGGVTWFEQYTGQTGCSIASSADGTKLVLGENPMGSVWTSPDAGLTWTPHVSGNNWYSVASSADGTKLVAAGGYLDSNTNYHGSIYFSGDSGATWTNAVTSASWSCVASSADGSKLVAGTFDGQLYTSVPTLVLPPGLTFTGATNQVVNLGTNGAVVTFNVTATSTNPCQPNVSIACTPPSGSTFPAGTNEVICVAIDAYGLTYTTNFLVDVRGTNPPTDIALSSSTLPSEQPPGTTVGTLTAIDLEPDTHCFALVPGAGDTDNDWFTIVGDTLQTAGILNYKFKSSYSIRVRDTNSSGLSVERVFTITLTDMNDAPVLDIAKVPALGVVGANAGAPVGAVGTAVTNLVDIGGPLSDVTDDDAGAVTGVAIFGADIANGTWFYTTNGGAGWNSLWDWFVAHSGFSLLLAAAPGNRVYFQPNTNFIGIVPAALGFRAWDQTSGSNGGWADTSSNGWTTAFSAAKGLPSQEVGWGYAVSLNGTNQYVQMPPGIWFSNDFTIEAWVYERNYNNWSRVIDFGNGTNDNVYLALSTATTGQPRLVVYVGASPQYIIAPGPIPLNQWVHLAATLRNNTATLYTNGVMAISGPVTPPNAVNRTNNYIGRSNWAADSYANAIFDEVRIWNVALTQAQIANNLLTTLAGNEPGLVAYYHFDEGKGLTAYDATTNHLDGVLINGPVWVPSTVPYSLTPVEFVSGDTIQYQGYWPGGVAAIANNQVPNLVVSGLNVNIQPGSGTPGLKLTDNNEGVNLTAIFDGGDWGIITTGGNAPGILATSGAANGGHGDDGIDDTAGGNGVSAGSVTIDSQGDITTGGASAPGILAQSTGGNGGNGGNGAGYSVSGCWGGSGGNGGQVVVQDNGGSISTTNNNSHGILALSLGGGGGYGGDAGSFLSTTHHGGHGGTGGNGGVVSVGGVGSIATTGDNSSGILSVSQAGQGGHGGSGTSSSTGGDGGIGGAGGAVNVDGSWSITTRGTNAPGISANSLGGDGGQPGQGGSIAGGGGAGGSSGNGGTASVEFGPGASASGGTIETFGQDSHGIFAQSVGGFAGNGASGSSPVFSSSGGDGGSAGSGGSASIINSGQVTTHGQGADAVFAESVGGGGGSSGSGSGWFGGNAGTPKAGGNGGAVSVVNSGAVRTEGYNARGIFAQSVGGSGGNCGYTVGLKLQSIGGSGGYGGNGGSVNVANTGIVTTTNSDATAIFAQSTGGGGGTGGGSGALGVGFSLAVGGSGGGGGSGGSVTVSSGNNSITTQGTNSHGIFAQSVGGGGGRGGYAISDSVSLTGSESISVGGTGGGGGNGGNVVVTNGSAITTQGTNSHGIFAQSVGGGGGSGGFSFAGSISAVAGALSIGGRGNIGGTGDSVTVINTGTINTTDDRSYGILAQSVGGGGGDGGFSAAGAVGGVALPVSMGGQGGAGGNANAVTLDNSGAITTLGNDSHGIFAQSVGGGGGSGGFSLAAGAGAYAGSLSFGGSGSGGGNSGPVTVNSTGGAISTFGDRSYGILAQSVGGGGGDGGFSVAGAFSGAASAPLSFGGSAAGGGSAGNVSVNSQSQINTVGDDSHGVFAQSVGGGGGSGGFSVSGGISGGATVGAAFGGSGGGGGSAGNVSVTAANAISTAGNRSYGILAQSIGGGGGDGGFSVAGGMSGVASANLAMGGSGGGGGVGGSLTVNSASSINTSGSNSHAIFAQSVGGGGGSGGFSGSASAGGTFAAGLSMGGIGGQGGKSDVVNVTNTGDLHTSGQRSYGILAQSVGGGGGDGGSSIAVSGGGTVALSGSVGGSGGVGGDGSAVTVTSAGTITTLSDDAHGIFAQSVGGGGGSGGFSGSASGSGTFAGAFSMGGHGTSGGNGAAVNVASTGDIRTSGQRAYGILAQSIGGGGGDGGFSAAASGAGNATLNASLGGSGGGGGNGGAVSVTTSNNITTSGTNAHGIFAQSVGGGGGSGGFSVTAGGSGDFSGSLSLGGSGSGGGNSSTVTVKSSGTITTGGDRAYGILAQSVGGGGGDGGFSVAANFSGGSALSVSLGGSGAGGGSGGNVALTNQSAITTRGNDAHGIFAQSVGGGGGSGGFSVAGGISSDASVSAAFGGSGGGGNSAGNVSVTNSGAISTAGNRSYGILAQSVGGGGGDGGFSVAGGLSSSGGSASLGLGGSGGSGGVAGTVDVNSASSISTSSSNSHAIFAQSVGGGGGSGGFSIALDVSSEAAVSAAIGGSGGSGANASGVNVTSTGATLQTAGDRSYGLLAQSVGGGGGDGGFSVAGGVSSDSAAVSLGLGGVGGVAGNGAAVAVTNLSTIITLGSNSHGIFAQSVGGGGGSGGFSVAGSISDGTGFSASIGGKGNNGGTGGNVILTNSGAISTAGDRAYGILAQSVGGGGGDGGFSVAGGVSQGASVNLGLGGGGGPGGAAGSVTVNTTNSITTAGTNAHGVFAQSVGGGGGSGGFSIAGGVSSDNASIDASLGGNGGSGGSAGNVTVNSASTIKTSGDRAYGILAQSVGGGGGDGGFSFSGAMGSGAKVTLSIGGQGSSGGVGRAVSVINQGSITTEGQQAFGLLAQSVGGGGGSGGMSGTLSVNAPKSGGSTSFSAGLSIGGNGGTGGNAGLVTVSNSGSIATRGDNSHGIFAQSVGGGGGAGGESLSLTSSIGSNTPNSITLNAAIGGAGGVAGNGSNVVVANYGSIATGGTNSYGILAQSVGGGGGDGGLARISNSGTQTNGTGSGTNLSVGITVGGQGGAAGDAGSVAVTNYGSIYTTNSRSYGIMAQSVGGGGGTGGTSVSDAGNAQGAVALNVSVGLGGKGGAGGAGNVVSVVNTNIITTLGDASHGIFAQSVGGGGGAGGASISTAGGSGNGSNIGVSVAVGIGGSGGAGSQGSNVVVLNSGQIRTAGQGSDGILAQSIGGGGGDGGMAQVTNSGTRTNASGSGTNLSVGVSIGADFGGKGGAAGNAGSVAVANYGSIYTTNSGSYGIMAQSVGGGGGTGGASVTDAGNAQGGVAVNLNFGLGGKGGAGGAGNMVSVINTNIITTLGDGSHGIFAQSVGGGGGAGGASLTTAGGGGTGTNIGVSVAVGIGGCGGAGSQGSNVVVLNSGQIRTAGQGSDGILAQSIGGGGGDGGMAQVTNSGTRTYGSGSGTNLSVGVSIGADFGGVAGAAGNAGSVVVSNTGSIYTTNSHSYGIMAQSAGGGGGIGGASVTDAGNAQGAVAATVNFGLGGKGGAGGAGNVVSVVNTSIITTLGDASHGIFAQSVGGGGGAGGASLTTAGGGGTGTNIGVSVAVGIGGGGGAGSQGSNVMVMNSGQITTAGQGSYGILAQSVGGGGGDGGMAQVTNIDTRTSSPWSGTKTNMAVGVTIGADFGGTGGVAGNAGSVAVTNNGTITTSNNFSHGIFAQSVGGGGGIGGASVTDAGSAQGGVAVTLNVGLGGRGGAGGAGNQVNVTNSNTITTLGDSSHGIFAQSVGGGGGAGGISVSSASGGAGSNVAVNLAVALGGTGGGGGNGSNVAVVTSGQIQTSGQGSYGIIAQSIGGGGGNAGAVQVPTTSLTNWSLQVTLGGSGGTAGQGGNVGVTNQGAIVTRGSDSYGVIAQSIGGGGGNAGSAHNGQAQSWGNLNIAVGGTGGGGGDGGSVSLANFNSITTYGDGSMGLIAQSIGGGGGMGASAGADQSGGLGVHIGGAGGTAGNGNAVIITQQGDITTSGVGANGILAQSVGGGGGLAGNLDRGLAFGVSSIGIDANFGQGGGNSGNGGSVTINDTGNISTAGTGANGILAQSIGGGGGLATGFAGSVGGSGSGGAINLNYSGSLTTSGDTSHGVFAQSVGGSNGFGGAVNITVAGKIVASGAGSDGIFAQSVGFKGGSNIVINIQSNTVVQGGTGSGVGVQLDGGATNTLTNYGTITTASGSNGTAISAGGVPTAPLRFYRVRVQSSGTNTARPRVWISRAAGSPVILQFTCDTNLVYAVEYTSDLGSGVWTEVPSPSFTVPAPGLGQWIDDGKLDSGNDTVQNYGSILGSVDLGTGQNAFNNYAGATLDIGSMGYLGVGAGNSVTNFGLLEGSGTILGDVYDGGMLSAANSASSLTIDGNLSLMSTANLTFDLGGLQQGSSYDFINVTNFVTFLGTLRLSLDNNFLPTATESFTLMQFGSSSGFFTNVLNGGRLLTLDGLGSFEVTCTANSLQISDFQSGTNGLSGSEGPVAITSFTRDASGHMVLQFACATNKNYVIKYAPDLRGGTWTPVPSPVFTSPAPGIAQWVDDGTLTGGLGGTARFYRVALPSE